MTGHLTAETLSAILARSGYVRTAGMEVVALSPETSTLTLRQSFTEGQGRIDGEPQFHGGAIMALADTAATFAVAMLTGRPAPTMNFRTDFLKPATCPVLFAGAVVRRLGRTAAVVDVDVTDGHGGLIAMARGAFVTGGPVDAAKS